MKIKYNDNELLYLISENDENAFEILCDKYRPLIISRLRSFKIQEKNFTDFYQECLMVLYQCSENYREDKNFTFNVYLDMSIQNKIRNLLRKDKNYFYNVSLLDVDTIDKITFKEPSYIELGENIEVTGIFDDNTVEAWNKHKPRFTSKHNELIRLVQCLLYSKNYDGFGGATIDGDYDYNFAESVRTCLADVKNNVDSRLTEINLQLSLNLGSAGLSS